MLFIQVFFNEARVSSNKTQKTDFTILKCNLYYTNTTFSLPFFRFCFQPLDLVTWLHLWPSWPSSQNTIFPFFRQIQSASYLNLAWINSPVLLAPRTYSLWQTVERIVHLMIHSKTYFWDYKSFFYLFPGLLPDFCQSLKKQASGMDKAWLQ